MEKNNSNNRSNSHTKIESSANLIEESIKEIQSILWFKKIIAFTGGWQGIKLNFKDDNIQKRINEESTHTKEIIIRDIISRLKNYDVAILSWWTDFDIPKIATNIANEYNLPTIWVLPRRWEKYSMWNEKLNIEIIVDSSYSESQYWDESSIFAKLSDWIIVIWWWSWTLIEFAHVMKINENLHRYNQALKKVIPIHWLGWLSEMLHHIPWNDEIKKLTLPKTTNYNWVEAFEWLKNELNLDEKLLDDFFIKNPAMLNYSIEEHNRRWL